MSEVEFPATLTVFWPGKTVHVCERHYMGLLNISQAMGMPAPDSREEHGHECKNCVHEYGKKA